MRVFVACEYSGTVRDAFIEAGHDCWSCDLPDVEPEGVYADRHIKGNALQYLHWDWDLLIAHPPCTRLCNSGVRWLAERNLWTDMKQAAELFLGFLHTDVPRICVENPIPHKYAKELIGDYTQKIQPWMFGHGETKATCLWLKELPLLEPTDIVEGREQRVWKLSPGKDRGKERSRFYKGIAKAMVEQWS